MRNVNYYILTLSAFVFLRCIDPTAEKVFDQGSNERIEAMRQTYLAALTAPAYGWIGEYAITHGDYLKDEHRVGAFNLLLKFNPQGRVLIKSDYKQGAMDAEVGYRIDQGWKMELVLESYSMFHDLAQSDQFSVRGGFVFNIRLDSLSGDITLSNRLHSYRRGLNTVRAEKTHMLLQPAKPEDWNLSRIYGVESSIPYQGVIVSGQESIPFEYKTTNLKGKIKGKIRRVMTLKPSEGLPILAPIRVTDTGFGFIPPVKVGSMTFSDFTYNANEETFVDQNKNTVRPVSHPELFGNHNFDILYMRAPPDPTIGPGQTTEDAKSEELQRAYDKLLADYSIDPSDLGVWSLQFPTPRNSTAKILSSHKIKHSYRYYHISFTFQYKIVGNSYLYFTDISPLMFDTSQPPPENVTNFFTSAVRLMLGGKKGYLVAKRNLDGFFTLVSRENPNLALKLGNYSTKTW